jgi:ELWxxDGT repeat protein
MVLDINPGPVSSYPGDLTDVNGTVFFAANDGLHGYELWRSDGTAAGTQMVLDINPGPASGEGGIL